VGRLLIVCRLAARDLLRRPTQTVLLLVVIAAAMAALTLGLILHGVTDQPYTQTRAATAGPDVVASSVGFPETPGALADPLRALTALAHAPGVVAHSGPYPVAWPTLRAHGITAEVMAQGRDPTPTPVDQPRVTNGSWVRDGGVVIERGFADAIGVHVADEVTLDGHAFPVIGIAVTAAVPVYTQVCFYGGCSGPSGQPRSFNTGLLWLIQPASRSLAGPSNPLTYYLNLRLNNPAAAPAFVTAHQPPPGIGLPPLTAWQSLRGAAATLITQEHRVLVPASWLLALLALASVAVVAGGRMAEQDRRVGLLKAAGGTPPLAAAVLLAQHVVVALAAAAAGLVAGWATAPLLTDPGESLVGRAGPAEFAPNTILLVVAVAITVAAAATLVPALRAARTSTIAALTEAPRTPRRRAGLIRLSTRLPVPLLLGLRLIARRPRRVLLSAASFTITATTAVAVLIFHATINHGHATGPFGGPPDPGNARVNEVLLVVTVVMTILAAANTIFTTWATVIDTRRFSAVARALGATPRQATAALSTTQLLPALVGALVGIPAGTALYAAVQNGGPQASPSTEWLLAVVIGMLLAVATLTAIPARIGTRQPIAAILQTETP
jgi:putative ABC transport system permease protein